ncbi:hypothetical protein M4578_15865 [Salipiger sp. P9]|nr:hypothetical protein [Salipiger pentaromativorans]
MPDASGGRIFQEKKGKGAHPDLLLFPNTRLFGGKAGADLGMRATLAAGAAQR